MHDMVEPSGSPRLWRQYGCIKPLREDASHAQDRVVVETPGKKQETNPAARNWQIRKTPGNIDFGSARTLLHSADTGSSHSQEKLSQSRNGTPDRRANSMPIHTLSAATGAMS